MLPLKSDKNNWQFTWSPFFCFCTHLRRKSTNIYRRIKKRFWTHVVLRHRECNWKPNQAARHAKQPYISSYNASEDYRAERWLSVLTGTERVRSIKHAWEYCTFFLLWRCDPTRVMASSFTRFLDHTQRRTTVGRTPLDEWSARRIEIYLTTHNTHNRQISMPQVGFEPTISTGERPQTYVLDSAATETGKTICMYVCMYVCICVFIPSTESWNSWPLKTNRLFRNVDKKLSFYAP